MDRCFPMTKLSLTLALAFALNGAEKKPAPLSNADKLRAAQAALELSIAENDYRRIYEALQTAKQTLESKYKAFKDISDELSKTSNASGCELHLVKQEWINCKPKTEPAAAAK
jgi:hypothetical protein